MDATEKKVRAIVDRMVEEDRVVRDKHIANRTAKRAFMTNVSQEGSFRDCWPWIGETTMYSLQVYGWIPDEETLVSGTLERGTFAHVRAWGLWRGDVPDRGVVYHNCGNTLCVNPEHLKLHVPTEEVPI